MGIGCSNLTGHIVKLDLQSHDARDLVNVSDATSTNRSCLGGTLNPSLLNLTHLNYLDLSQNNFQGAAIPEFIGSLKHLRYLDLCSAFSFPEWLYLSKASTNWLHAVNMLLHYWSCIYPALNSKTSLSIFQFKMRSLESLDLSYNHLVGSTPPSMSSLTSLSYLNLSYNNLSGQIPSTNQFLTFTGPSRGDNVESEDNDGHDIFWFYVSVGLGFIVGFWAVCCTLVIKKSWRDAYFKFIDEMKGKLF
ncbi:serine-threonine protein kinase, plant-type, putative [Ricinus communis]|uniref:Serine-threonine protein kinase, plant-type, putative n=1 Tax=Ricinus communis TaxID=3988 RepID=B9RMG9_RICCO|nr:serine-threonine protein kinase, plant-type, putative [Ricinus communis]